MTAHDMTLPGRTPEGTPGTARCWECPVIVGPVIDGDTADAWHAALKADIETAELYLSAYSPDRGDHALSCTLKMLPPSIHLLFATDYEAISAERDLANGMMNGM
jgi:hypothetical protein